MDAGDAPGPRSPVPLATTRSPERLAAGGTGASLLTLMLDEVAYGMVLLDEGSHVLYANPAARAEFEAGHPLLLLGRELRARHIDHRALLQDALAAARRGRRKLLALGDATRPVNVAVIPLGGTEAGATLLMMGKHQASEPLSVQAFAHCHGLTPAETRVLEGLCQGRHPRELALRHSVSLATVRSQVRSLRAKTGATSIRALLRQVSVLPPMLGSPRNRA